MSVIFFAILIFTVLALSIHFFVGDGFFLCFFFMIFVLYAGMELASVLAGTAASVTAIDVLERPYQLVFGKEIGTALMKVGSFFLHDLYAVHVC